MQISNSEIQKFSGRKNNSSLKSEIYKIFTVLSLLIFLGCSSQSHKTTLINSASIPKRIIPGMKRADAEVLLGKPYSVQAIISQDPKFNGVEVWVLYSPALRYMEQQISDEMKDNQDISTTVGILSGSLSIGGYAVTGANIATSIASSGVGAAGDLASNKLDTTIFDPSKISCVVVVYRNNSVSSIEQRNLSSAPR